MTIFLPGPALHPFKSYWASRGNGPRGHYAREWQVSVHLLLHGNLSRSFLCGHIIQRPMGQCRYIAPGSPEFGLPEPMDHFGFRAREQAKTVVDVIGTLAWPLIDKIEVTLFSMVLGDPSSRRNAFLLAGVVRFFFTRGVVKDSALDLCKMRFAPFQNRSARLSINRVPWQLLVAIPFFRKLKNRLPAVGKKLTLALRRNSDFAFQEKGRERFQVPFARHRSFDLTAGGHFVQEDVQDANSEAIVSFCTEGKARPTRPDAID